MNCEASLELNGKSTLTFSLPVTSSKWDLFSENITVQVDDREYVFLNPNDTERAKTLDGTIRMVESWNLLGRVYTTVGSTDYAATILSGEAGEGGYDAGSAGSALYRLLNGVDWTSRTEWTVGTVDVDGFHDLETEKQTLLENIYEVQKIWGGWIVWDSINHTVSLRDDTLWANDTGFEIRYKKNEKTLKKIEDWELVVTRLIPFGEKDLDIGSVNGGVKYLENFTYVSEARERINRWENITDPDELKATATTYLAQYCRPQVQYESEMVDLRALTDYSHELFSIGDIITIQDEDLADAVKIRLIAHTYDILQPWKCKVKLGDILVNAFASVVSTTRKVNLIYGDTKSTITNFDLRNDRDGSAIVDPVVESDGSAVDHVINTDSTANISFEWTWTGEETDIDGWVIYVRQSSSATSYNFGTTPSEELTYYLTADRRAFIMHGVPVNMYYTFGVRAYRVVDPDINAAGVIQSNIVQPSLATEDPYRPSASVAFAGDVSGTVNGTAGSTITTAVTNFNNRNDRKDTVPANPTIASDGSAVDHTANTDSSVDISFEWDFSGSGDAYDIDGFMVFIKSSTSSSPYVFSTDAPTYTMPSIARNVVLRGQPADLYYTFGVQSYRIVDPDVNANGILKSSIVQPTHASEDPYQPSTSVAFDGDITGTIAGQAAATVASTVGFGNGADGELSTSGNVTFEVTEDTGVITKDYTTLTVNAGHIITTNNRCKGLVIRVQGDCNIDGTISMDDRAARVERDSTGTPWQTVANASFLSKASGGIVSLLIPAGGAGGTGGAGGRASGVGVSPEVGGIGGSNCAYGGSGGGGGGGGQASMILSPYAGGGGGGAGNGGDGGDGSQGTGNGTPGDPGVYGAGTGGSAGAYGSPSATAGGAGGGGILILCVGGNLTIGATGVIRANSTGSGGNGGGSSSVNLGSGGGGGGAGGGVVLGVCNGTYTNLGSITVNGSAGGSAGSHTNPSYKGEDGSSGQVGSIILFV